MKSNQRWTRAGIGAMVAALAVLVPIGFGLGAVSAGAAAPHATGATAAVVPPWEPDNNAALGGIDFYNAAGVQINSGSITDSPMAAYAIAQNGSSGATKAALFGFLPKTGLNSPVGNGFVDSFQGEVLSASTTYPNSAAVAAIAALPNPVVTGASGDETLQALEGDLQNTDTSTDGFAGMYQLRMKIAGPGIAISTYAATDIMISGTTWTQVYGSFTSPVTAGGGGSGATQTSSTVTANPASGATTTTSVTFTATLNPSSAAGTVQFMDGANPLGSAVTVSGGTATSAATTLTATSHAITAVFTPNNASAFTTSTSPVVTYVVAAAGGGSTPVATSSIVTASPPSPTTLGTSVTFTATMTPSSAAGTVQFKDGANLLGTPVTLAGGTATSAAVTNLSQTTHTITALFTPADATAFVASTGTLTYVVGPVAGATATTTTLTANPVSPTTAGTSVTFTATVAPAAAGTVQFVDGSSNLGTPATVNATSGVATLTTTTLTQATHTITAVFTPTTPASFQGSTSSALSFIVNASTTALATTTALAVSPASTATSGTAVQLTATVTCAATCTPAGTVGFWDGGSVQIGTTQTVVSGSATVSTTALAIGSTHSLVAIFTPTDQTAFTTSQSTAVPYSITATDAGSATVTDSTGTALGADPTLAPGQTVTVQASGFTAGEAISATVHSVPETLTPATASSTGTVAYTFTVPTDLPAGAHTLVLAGATSAHTVTIDFSIATPSVLGTTTTTTPSAGSASLPFTGADIGLLSAVAAVCMCVGFVIRFGAPEPRRIGAHERRGPGTHARMGAKHSRH
jgi:hypothetical protein